MDSLLYSDNKSSYHQVRDSSPATVNDNKNNYRKAFKPNFWGSNSTAAY